MGEVSTVGLHLAKIAFQAHGADASDRAVVHKTFRRPKALEFFGRLPPSGGHGGLCRRAPLGP
jgi:transposase